MIDLSKFKVDKNCLIYGDYCIAIKPQKDIVYGSYLQYTVSYKNSLIFSDDNLEDVIQVVFELEKDDQDYKDRKAFEKVLNKILNKGKNQWLIKITSRKKLNHTY